MTDFQLLTDRAYSVIKGKIRDLAFWPGEQLIEQRIALEMGISKSPIRDALQRLNAEGLVQAIPYKGCFVAPISKQEFREVFQLREALELFSLEQAFDLYTEQDMEEFEKTTRAAVSNMRQDKQFLAYTNHLTFHKLIVEKLGNELITGVYSKIEDKLTRYLNIVVKHIPDRIRRSNEQHEVIFEAFKARNKKQALAEMQHHLSSVLEDYLNRPEIEELLKRVSAREG
jgi:DNA-binding GntR family transcriptional regulator